MALSQPRQSDSDLKVRIVKPFETAVAATLGVILGCGIFIWGSLALVDILDETMSAADVRTVCATHEGVQTIYGDDGLLLPSRLVLCRDGYVGEPKP